MTIYKQFISTARFETQLLLCPSAQLIRQSVGFLVLVLVHGNSGNLDRCYMSKQISSVVETHALNPSKQTCILLSLHVVLKSGLMPANEV